MRTTGFSAFILIIVVLFASVMSCGSSTDHSRKLENHYYSEQFENGELNGWASYPLWQDTAYDQKFRVNTIVPGDDNIAIEQLVTPYTAYPSQAGAQKKLHIILTRDSILSFRLYLKTHLTIWKAEVHAAAGEHGMLSVKIDGISANTWNTVTVSYEDIIDANPKFESLPELEIFGIAVSASFPESDPDIPIYFGLDDISVIGKRPPVFSFDTPEVNMIPEYEYSIPLEHYETGDTLTIAGRWPGMVSGTSVWITPFTNNSDTLVQKNAESTKDDSWVFSTVLNLGPGLYTVHLAPSETDESPFTETLMTIYVRGHEVSNLHPRLFFDSARGELLKRSLVEPKWRGLASRIKHEADSLRTAFPLEEMAFDFDQFPEEGWLVSRYAWSLERIRFIGHAVKANAYASYLLDDIEARDYARAVLTEYVDYPTWLHPWMKKRGRHFYLFMGDMAMDFALGYDLLYHELSPDDRTSIRQALLEKVIIPAHKGYVSANLVTSNTSNWIAAIIGGSIACQAAVWGDSTTTAFMEPYFTGAMLKMHAYITTAVGEDGGYGEGYNYYNYAMLSWSKSLPPAINVFNIDLSEHLLGSQDEFIWSGIVQRRRLFTFGDSRYDLAPMDHFAWLWDRYRDPHLGWMYRNSKYRLLLSFSDLLYRTENLPSEEPFNEQPCRLFRDIGTVVFRSGWSADDFLFVLRCGAIL